MNIEPIEYNCGIIWVDDNIKQADEGYNVYLSSANVYFTKGIHLLEPFNKEKDHFGLFYPKEANDFSQYVTLKQDIKTTDIGNGYKFCNVKYLKRIVAQSSNLSIPNIPYIEVEEYELSLIVDKLDTPEGLNRFSFDVGFVKGYRAASSKKWGNNTISFEDKYELADTIRKAYLEFGKDSWVSIADKVINTLSKQPKIKSIEIEMEDCEAVKDAMKHWIRSGKEGTPLFKEELVPITYQKDGKTFLKVKSIQYEKI